MGATRYIIILTLLKSVFAEHEPKVYEELTEELPAYQRTARHLDAFEKQYEPPIFNYRQALQQDRLKTRYTRQQQADARNIKYRVPINHNFMRQYLKEDRGTPVNMPFVEENSDWKPFQPKLAPTNEINDNDLDIAGSETNEQTLIKDRQDQYAYKSADQISQLQKLLGKNPSLQLQGLQKLIQPTLAEIQHNGSPLPLRGLPRIKDLQQKLDAVNKAQENQILAHAHIKAEAHVKAQHEAIAAARQKAQEAALAKIAAHNQGLSSTLSSSDQYNILEDASQATAAALNRGPHIPYKTVPENEDNSLPVDDTPLLAALHGRHFDLRNIKPRIRPTEAPITNNNYRPIIHQLPEDSSLHYKSTGAPNLQYMPTEAPNFLYVTVGDSNLHYPSSTEYASPTPGTHNRPEIQVTEAHNLDFDTSKIHNYSPLSPYNKVTEEPTHSPLNDVEPVQNSHQHIQVELAPSRGKSLYSQKGHSLYDDVQQYAAKYAFGYRIIDEKHGNDFGHKEERNEKLTKGQYFVNLPDGRRQKVDYYADDSGYHAKVSYENEAKHPYVGNGEGHLGHL